MTCASDSQHINSVANIKVIADIANSYIYIILSNLQLPSLGLSLKLILSSSIVLFKFNIGQVLHRRLHGNFTERGSTAFSENFFFKNKRSFKLGFLRSDTIILCSPIMGNKSFSNSLNSRCNIIKSNLHLRSVAWEVSAWNLQQTWNTLCNWHRFIYRLHYRVVLEWYYRVQLLSVQLFSRSVSLCFVFNFVRYCKISTISCCKFDYY